MATRQDWTFHRLAFPHSTAHAFPMMPLAIQPGFIPRRAPRTTFGTTEKHKRGRLLVLSHCVLHLCRPKCIFGQLFLNHPLFLWYPVQTLPLHPPVPTPTETHMLPFHPHTHCSDCSPLAMGQRPGYGGTVWDRSHLLYGKRKVNPLRLLRPYEMGPLMKSFVRRSCQSAVCFIKLCSTSSRFLIQPN